MINSKQSLEQSQIFTLLLVVGKLALHKISLISFVLHILQEYFTSIGYSLPPERNPADFYLQVIDEHNTNATSDSVDGPKEKRTRIRTLGSVWRKRKDRGSPEVNDSSGEASNAENHLQVLEEKSIGSVEDAERSIAESTGNTAEVIENPQCLTAEAQGPDVVIPSAEVLNHSPADRSLDRSTASVESGATQEAKPRVMFDSQANAVPYVRRQTRGFFRQFVVLLDREVIHMVWKEELFKHSSSPFPLW